MANKVESNETSCNGAGTVNKIVTEKRTVDQNVYSLRNVRYDYHFVINEK